MADFEWYRSFLAVYRVGTVSGAALSRFLTQPAITQHLAALERVVGEPLFTRLPRQMLPTERGKVLYTQIVTALEKLEEVSANLVAQTETARPVVRLGTPREFFYERGLVWLKGLEIKVTVSFGETPALIESLSQGELDLVIATQRVSHPGLEYRPIYEEEFWLVGPALLAAPDEQSEAEAWLLRQTWLSYGPELPIIRRFWQATFGHRPELEPTLIVPDLHTLLRAVELGQGLTVLPDYLCQKEVEAGRLSRLWQPLQPITNTLYLAYRKLDRYRPEIAQVLERSQETGVV